MSEHAKLIVNGTELTVTTFGEISSVFRIKRDRVYELAHKGTIPIHYKVGKKIFVATAALNNFLNAKHGNKKAA